MSGDVGVHLVSKILWQGASHGWCHTAGARSLSFFVLSFFGFRVRVTIVNPRKLEHGFRMNSAGIPLYFNLKGMRITMFQLSGSYCRDFGLRVRVTRDLGFRT